MNTRSPVCSPRLTRRLGPAAVRLATGAAVLVLVLWLSNCRVTQLLSRATPDGPFTVTPTEVLDSALAGSNTVRRRTVVISSAGRWRAATEHPWIAVSPAGGTPGTLLTLGLDSRDLSPGAYEGSVMVTAVDAGDPPARIAVSFFIQQPILKVEPDEVSRSTREETVFHDTVRITNTGTGPLVWSARATSTSPWLAIDIAAGTGNGIMPLRLSTHGLRTGTYETTIEITAPGAKDSPASVKVELRRRNRWVRDDNDDDDHDA